MGLSKSQIEEIIRAEADHDCSGDSGACVRIAAIADLPTRYGEFQVVAFDSPRDGKEHAALIRGDVFGGERVPVRLHSECLTGDALASLRCDCRQQLELALQVIGQRDAGAILYLRQEGRGIGFANKIRAYQLQERGFDTIEANQVLGFLPDERDYEVAAHMLYSLKVRSVLLMSNNPDKIADLQSHGVTVEGRIPIEVPPNPHNLRYLETKRVKAGHLLHNLPVAVDEQLDELPTVEEGRNTGP